MAVTAAEIRNRAGVDLGLIPINQSLQSQDSTRITSAYNEVYARLKKEGLATWASTGSVPDELAPLVIVMVCQNCLETYSVSLERAQRINNKAGFDGTLAMRAIRDLVASDYSLPETEVDDF